MNQIKVAHVTTIDKMLSGILHNQLISIQQEGYDVSGISSPGSEVPYLENELHIEHLAVPMTRNFTPLADLVSLWRLYRVMKREGFSVVHTHNPKPGLIGQLAARMAGVPVIVNTVHGFYFHEHSPAFWKHFYITMEKIAALCSDVILSQNAEDRQTAIREGIVKPHKIKHLGNGIDVERFDRTKLNWQLIEQKRRELGLANDALVVGFVGRLVAEKGLPELFQAAKLVLEQLPQTRFLIVGASDLDKSDAIRPEATKEYGIADAFIFTGERHDVPELLAMMDIMVLPSHREGFPRVLMEASALKVPCVSTNIRGSREAVEHNRNGLLVPLFDIPAMAEAIIDLLKDPSKRERMGAEGRSIALERFDEQLIFNTIKAEYARLLKKKGLPVPQPETLLERKVIA